MNSYSDQDINISLEYPDNWEFEKSDYNGHPRLGYFSPKDTIDLYIQTNNRDDVPLFDTMSEQDMKSYVSTVWSSYSEKLKGNFELIDDPTISIATIDDRKFALLQVDCLLTSSGVKYSYNFCVGAYDDYIYSFVYTCDKVAPTDDLNALSAIIQSVEFTK